MQPLQRADVDRFLRALADRVPCPAKVILTGGCEALLLGGQRATGDLDIGIELSERYRRRGPEVEDAVAAAAAALGLAVQYSSDIDRWSSISVPRPKRRTRPLKRIGRLNVHLLDPAVWAVYKLARYLDSDVHDLIAVLRAERVDAGRVARLCGHALRESPRSSALFLFRQQVEHFLREHGRTVWGRRFDAERVAAQFHRAAGIGTKRS
jgi:hypothetical protein